MSARTVAAAIEHLLGESWMPRVVHWEIATTDDVWGAHAELDVRAEDPAYREFRALADRVGGEFADDGRQIRIDFEYDDVSVRVWWLRPILRWIVPETCATCPTKLGEPDVPFVRLGDGAGRREAPVICVPCRDRMQAAWIAQAGATAAGLSEPQLAAIGVPSPERLREVQNGGGAPLTDEELTWLRGDAGRYELHVRGAQSGHFPMLDDLPGAVVALAQRLGAAVAEVDRLREERASTNKALHDATVALRAGCGTALTEAAAEFEKRTASTGERLVGKAAVLRFLCDRAAAKTGGGE